MSLKSIVTILFATSICVLFLPSSFAESPNATAASCAQAGGRYSDIYCFCGWQTFLDPAVQKCSPDKKVIYTGFRIEPDFKSRPPVEKNEDLTKVKKLRELEIGKCEYTDGLNIDGLPAKPGQPSKWPVLTKTFQNGDLKPYCFGKVSCRRTNNRHVTVFSAACPARVTTCDGPGTCLEKQRENDPRANGIEHNIEFTIRNSKLEDVENASAESIEPATPPATEK